MIESCKTCVLWCHNETEQKNNGACNNIESAYYKENIDSENICYQHISKSLIEHDFLKAIQDCLEKGSKKNGRKPGDWKNFDEAGWNNCHDALYRHIVKSSSDKKHYAYAACRLMMLYWKACQDEAANND